MQHTFVVEGHYFLYLVQETFVPCFFGDNRGVVIFETHEVCTRGVGLFPPKRGPCSRHLRPL